MKTTPAEITMNEGERPNYAGFCRRLCALLIDVPLVVIVLVVEVIILAVPVGIVSVAAAIPEHWSRLLAEVAGIIVVFVGPLPYFAWLESSAWQGTVGKRLLGMQVVDLSLERLGFRVACGRFMWKWLSLLPSGAGFLVALLRENRQAFHDSVNGTLVVRGNPSRRTTR